MNVEAFALLLFGDAQANEEIGDLENIIIDPESGRLLYGIVEYRNRYYAVPWYALTLSPDAKRLTLNCEKSQLVDAMGFEKDRWPNMSDPTWASNTYRHFGLQPYWSSK